MQTTLPIQRMQGAMVGLALGDALGATTEFLSRAQVRNRYPGGLREIVGGGAFNWAPGDTTDDTAMALALARGVQAAGVDAPIPSLVNAVGREFHRWADSGPKDIGATCSLAISAFRRLGDWGHASAYVAHVKGDQSAGNGALMRTLPISFLWPADAQRTVDVSRALAKMTHPHPEAEWTAAAYNLCIQALVRGENPRMAWAWATGVMYTLASDLSDVGHRLSERLWTQAVQGRQETEIKSTGYCVDTLEAALWAFWTTDSAEECIVRAANLGGDADTVAAVAGGLAGACYGVDGLPSRWLERLNAWTKFDIAAILSAL